MSDYKVVVKGVECDHQSCDRKFTYENTDRTIEEIRKIAHGLDWKSKTDLSGTWDFCPHHKMYMDDYGDLIEYIRVLR